MEIPPNMTKEEVIEVIDRITSALCRKFRFGYHDPADIKSQGTIFAIEALPRYDKKRKLANFLYRHVRNRLSNYKRDNYKRYDYPCSICHEVIRGERTKHPDGEICERYKRWAKRNLRRQNLTHTLSLDNIAQYNSKEYLMIGPEYEQEDISNIVERMELIDKISQLLPLELRGLWLKMRDGASIPKPKRELVINTIKRILKWEQEKVAQARPK